jgi:hypothetical protein
MTTTSSESLHTPESISVDRNRGARRMTWFLGTAVVLLLAIPPLLRAVPPYLAWRQYQPQEGDVLFQSLPRNELVNAIEGSTGSLWSHCGLVAREDGQWVVYEAIGEVRKTPLNEFYRRGRDGRFAAYRFKEADGAHIPQVIEKARAYLGRPYDVRYRMDDESIYCSELIYKAYRDATKGSLGKLVKLGDLKWRPYQQVIERLEGGPVPVEREMITPRDLALAEPLQYVAGTAPAEKR